MRRPFYLLVIAVSLPFGRAASYSPESLAGELRRLESALNDPANARALTLPAAWDVSTADRDYAISTEPLRSLLAKGDRNIPQAQAGLDMLARQLENGDAPPRASGSARAQLKRILGRAEFVQTPPSPLELLREQIIQWIQELVRRIFGAAAAHPVISELLFWVVVAACVGFLAVWFFGWWNSGRLPALPQPPEAPRHLLSWQQWLAEAHRAAAAGDWRAAIHAAYWAAVARLQLSGALPEDGTHTPREYLRLYAADASQSREALAALTAALERFWYAGRAVSAGDFRESLIRLEALGCKAD
jgi:hypothetical protein